MKKRMLALIFAAALVLSGCQLATTDGSGSLSVDDQLVGMYITLESEAGQVPVWNAEEMGMEHLHRFQSEGEKLYATRVETPDTTDDGVSDPRHSWKFPEEYGLTFMTFYEHATDESEGFWNFVSDPELSGLRKYTSINEDGAHIELECIVYVPDTMELGELALFMNPVYQTPDGEVYALGTSPEGSDAATMNGTSQTVSQETSTALADGIKTCGATVTLRIEKVVLPERYVVLEMDGENQVLRSAEYAPEEMPETYTPGADAAYLILESRGAEKAVRTVYSPDDESKTMDTFCPGRFGICIKGYTHIEWEG